MDASVTLSREKDRVEQMVNHVKEIPLSNNLYFMEKYVSSMYFSADQDD
jgi:hypothetical protein